MEAKIYVIQTQWGYQLSAYPHEVGLDDEVSADFLMTEEAYRHYLREAGGESLVLDEETNHWQPFSSEEQGSRGEMVMTYFKELAQAQQAVNQLKQVL